MKPIVKFSVLEEQDEGSNRIFWKPATEHLQKKFNLKHILFDVSIKEDTVYLRVEFESLQEIDEFDDDLISYLINDFVEKNADYEDEFGLLSGGDDDEPIVYGFTTDEYLIDTQHANQIIGDVIASVESVFNVDDDSRNQLIALLEGKGYQAKKQNEEKVYASDCHVTLFADSKPSEEASLDDHHKTKLELS